MRGFNDGGGVDSYTANRYRGQHGQISFITGQATPEESKQPVDTFIQSPTSPTNNTASSTSSYPLAPVQDFQRRGRSQSPPRRRDDTIDLDLSHHKPQHQPAIIPYQPQPTSKYMPYPSPASPPTYNIDSIVALLYDLRASLTSEQEQRKSLHAQLTEMRSSTQSNLSDLRSSLGRVSEDVKGGESRLLQLNGRLKEMEVQSSVELRLQEKSDRVDERALLGQHQNLQSIVNDLRQQLEEQGQRHRDDLELVHREHQRAMVAMKEQAMDVRQGMEDRINQQAEVMAQRLQVAMERMEGGAGSREELASLTGRMASLQGECSAMEVTMREMRDMTRREGDDAHSKGDWVRTVMTEQLQQQGRAIQDKIDTVEEGRRTLHQAQQREMVAMREELDRRLKDVQTGQGQAMEREREAREDSSRQSHRLGGRVEG
jgi:hypothetical protein